MRFLALLLALFSLSATTALADCFERVYSSEHLKTHPKQEVRSILFGVNNEFTNGESRTLFRLQIDLVRDGKRVLAEATGECSSDPSNYLKMNCKFSDGSGSLTSTDEMKDGDEWYKYSRLIKVEPGSEFTNLLAESADSKKTHISNYDSTMRVHRNGEASIIAQSCEAPLFQAYLHSTPRLWNEVLLHSIRNDLARPTVTARNLFHFSTLLWDVYAAYDEALKAYFVDRKLSVSDKELQAHRNRAMSYAAYHFLKSRYRLAPGNTNDVLPDPEFPDGIPDNYLNLFYDRVMQKLGYPITITKNMEGYEAAMLGQEMAQALLELVAEDGSRESENHTGDPSYQLINEAIVDVSQSGLHTPKGSAEDMINAYYAHVMDEANSGQDVPFDISPYLGEDVSNSISIDHWVRLHIPGSIDQGGNAQGSEQSPLTLFWGQVPTFSDLEEFKSQTKPGVYFDPGSKLPLFATDAEIVIRENLQVIDFSALLNPVNISDQDFDRDGKGDANPGAELIDISPASLGNNPLGTNAGTGRKVNPVTGKPYSPNLVKAADYYRSIAEFWADGPSSETPPGHWNGMANFVMDAMARQGQPFRWMGQGEALAREQFELKLYLTLNGALHDAAIVAWGIKGEYQGNRPVVVIRVLAAMAERDPAFAEKLVSYSPNLKMVTYDKEIKQADGSVKKEKVRKLAVRAWRGPDRGYFYLTELGGIELRDLSFRSRDETANREAKFYSDSAVAGVGWILADNWMPYQRQSFVTPPFPGFISGHSTFSRAAAEVLTHVTGSEYFPGGMGEYPAPPLHFEGLVTQPFNFQWATYYDASDVSGISRLYGGIHASYDDLPARVIGSKVGIKAVERAVQLFQDGEGSLPTLSPR